MIDRICPVGMVKCNNDVQCIYAFQFCGGYHACSDKSDEYPKICKKGNKRLFSSLFVWANKKSKKIEVIYHIY